MHHALQLLTWIGDVVAPIASAILSLAVLIRLWMLFGRLRGQPPVRFVSLAPGPEVDPTGSEAW